MKLLEGNAGKTLEDTSLSQEILKRPQGVLKITAGTAELQSLLVTKDSGRVTPTTHQVKEPAVWEETLANRKSDPDKFLESTYFERKAKKIKYLNTVNELDGQL